MMSMSETEDQQANITDTIGVEGNEWKYFLIAILRMSSFALVFYGNGVVGHHAVM